MINDNNNNDSAVKLEDLLYKSLEPNLRVYLSNLKIIQNFLKEQNENKPEAIFYQIPPYFMIAEDNKIYLGERANFYPPKLYGVCKDYKKLSIKETTSGNQSIPYFTSKFQVDLNPKITGFVKRFMDVHDIMGAVPFNLIKSVEVIILIDRYIEIVEDIYNYYKNSDEDEKSLIYTRWYSSN